MDAKSIVSELTLEEKASLCSGAKTFLTQGISRLDVPSFEFSDGPHGLRKQEGKQDHMGQNESIKATCFPAACAVGASFNPALAREMGETLGKACQANGVAVLLGPGVNIKRSPLCGRNFEYYSEDPLLSGKLGAAWVEGVQSQGVGACVKHFLANNQETRRRTENSTLDERTLREIYAPAFEYVVKQAKPWSIMAAYNKVDGTYMTENAPLLRGLLRDEWDFDGLVVSDWNAVHDRVAAIKGGCALTMPNTEETNHKLVDAVEADTLSENLLDEACEQIVELALKARENARPETTYDFEAAHELARKIAAESIVLLKNSDNMLPLDSSKDIALIGAFAAEPRYQGGGSSKVNAYRVPSLCEMAAGMPNVQYYKGFGMGGKTDPEALAEAVAAAQKADVAVIVAGLPVLVESEGFDRWVMKLPECQNELIEAVCTVQPNTVVILQNGSPVEMPWRAKPKAIIETYLGGEAASEAIWDVLTGKVNPSGHLAETFPEKLEDNPSYLFWPGEKDNVTYPEGVFVGYRYYASKNAAVAYPFGFGLSYTTFAYSNLTLSQSTFAAGQTMQASVTVTNTGMRAGKALVQLYVGCSLAETGPRRPVRELRGFEKIELAVGESRTVTFELASRDFSYWDTDAHSWRVAGGKYEVQIAENAQSVLIAAPVEVEDEYLPSNVTYNIMSPIGDVIKNPVGKEFCESAINTFRMIMAKMGIETEPKDVPYEELRTTEIGLLSEPLQTLRPFTPDKTEADWQAFFAKINADSMEKANGSAEQEPPLYTNQFKMRKSYENNTLQNKSSHKPAGLQLGRKACAHLER